MSEAILNLILGLFVVAALVGLLWPNRGLLARWNRGRQTTERVLREDAAKHIHKREMSGSRSSLESLAGALQISLDQTAGLVSEMESHGLLEMSGGHFKLTPNGRSYALHIIRAHRLWERYLADETGLPETEWHSRAERSEHELTPAQLDRLAAQLGNPLHDPHGDPIPTSEGHVVPHGGFPLTEMEPDRTFRIVHIEDEPGVIYNQLIAEGFHPGMVGRVTGVTGQRISVWLEGEERRLAPILARNVSVISLVQAEEESPHEYERLSSLEEGDEATVVRLSKACRGGERRRLMDLGALPGTVIRAEMKSPGGDPTAYWIRDALIGLRKEQADSILIKRSTN